MKFMKFNRNASAIEESAEPARLVDPRLSLSEQIDILQNHLDDVSRDLDKLSFSIQAALAEDENSIQM